MINAILNRLKRVYEGKSGAKPTIISAPEHGKYNRLSAYGTAQYAKGYGIYSSSQYGYSTYDKSPEDTTTYYGVGGYGGMRYQ